MIRALCLALLALAALGFVTARARSEPACVPPASTLDALRAMGRTVVDISDKAAVARGIAFLDALAGYHVDPAPDRFLIVGHEGSTSVIFGLGGLICPPVALPNRMAREFRQAIFGGPAGEDI